MKRISILVTAPQNSATILIDLNHLGSMKQQLVLIGIGLHAQISFMKQIMRVRQTSEQGWIVSLCAVPRIKDIAQIFERIHQMLDFLLSEDLITPTDAQRILLGVMNGFQPHKMIH